MKQNNFKIVCCCFQAQNTIIRCIESLKKQNYENWEAVFIDDCSTDNTYKYIVALSSNDKRIKTILNESRKYSLFNRITGTHYICKDNEDIIIVLDGDDYLADKYVLEYLNHIYQDDNVWMTYGQFQNETGEIGGCRDSYIPFYRTKNTDRNLSHLRSYKYHLFKQIKHEDFLDSSGNYYFFAEDIIQLFPMAEIAGNHLKFLSRINYIYNNITPLNDYKINKQNQIKTYIDILKISPYPINNKKLTIQLYDLEFAHCNYSGTDRNPSSLIEWFRGEPSYSIAVYTDRMLPLVNEKKQYHQKLNIAWLLEPSTVNPSIYSYILSHYKDFDYVFTHDESILNHVPNSFFIPFGLTWITRKDWNIYEKTQNVSFIVSEKKELPQHIFRHSLIEKIGYKIDKIVGKGYSPIENKIEALKDFRYNIVVQNSKTNFYFTEHLIDCFLTGTVPIFNGCSKISQFFDIRGMYTFSTVEELDRILNIVSSGDYLNKKPYIEENFQRALNYSLPEDYMYNNFFRKILAGAFIR